jgi:hypothetical protein
MFSLVIAWIGGSWATVAVGGRRLATFIPQDGRVRPADRRLRAARRGPKNTLAPFAERLVRGDEQQLRLVAAADQLKQLLQRARFSCA